MTSVKIICFLTLIFIFCSSIEKSCSVPHGPHIQDDLKAMQPLSNILIENGEMLREKYQDQNKRWDADLYLDKSHFTEASLTLLFRSYSYRHHNKDEGIIAQVYTDRSKLPLQRNWGYEPRLTVRWGEYITSPPPPFDAVFFKEGIGFSSPGSDNEWFSYKADLSDNDLSKIVIMKGALSQRQRAAEKIDVINGNNFVIRTSSFMLPDVSPVGFYHTVEIYDSNLKHWRTVITYQSDSRADNLLSHVNIINDSIIYLSIGGIFKVTVDGGKTWSKWEAEYDLWDWKRDESVMIQSTAIDNNGKGRMYVDRYTNRSKSTLSLTTKDFGQNWTIE